MIKLSTLALAGCLLASCTMVRATPAKVMGWQDLLGRTKPVADRMISYGESPLNVIDLWLPKGKPPHKVVLMLHGGCWVNSVADRSIMNWIADDLRRQGIAVWNVEYRGADSGGGYPGTYQDVAKAADLLAREGAGYGLDTRRVPVIGHSAGGHLALWLANRAALPANSPFRSSHMFKPVAAISQGGIPDLGMISALPDHACGNEGAKAMAGTPSAGRRDIYADTSPPEMAQARVPQFLVNGDQDHVAPAAFAQDYVTKLRAKRATAQVDIVLATGHVELIAPETAAWKRQVELLRAAIRR